MPKKNLGFANKSASLTFSDSPDLLVYYAILTEAVTVGDYATALLASMR